MRSFSRQQLLPAVIFRAPTVEQLAQVLSQEEGDRSLPSLAPIQPHGSSAPFFWIHGDYRNAFLSEYLGPDQPLFGLEHQGLDGKPVRYTRVETIAEHYLRQIRHVQAQGPYLLGGFSFGGVVAFEIAQRLKAQGQTVSLLVMLDSPFPGGRRRPLPRAVSAAKPRRLLGHFQAKSSSLSKACSPRTHRSSQIPRYQDRERRSAIAVRSGFKRLVCNVCLRTGWTLPASVRSFYIVEIVYRRAMRNYSPRAFDGKAVYFKCMAQSNR